MTQSMPAQSRTDWVERSHQLAVRIIKLTHRMPRTVATQVLARQVVRSATSVVANLEEARHLLTKPEMVHRTGIARKEAKETLRWLLLIRDAELMPPTPLAPLISESDEIAAMLTAGLKKLNMRQR